MKKFLCLFAVICFVFYLACKPQPTNKIPSLSAEAEISLFPEAVKYDLNIEVDYDQEILSTDCQILIKNPGDEPILIIPLNLYRLLEVLSITDGKGQALDYSQTVSIYEDWKQFQVNHIRIKLNQTLLPGETESLLLRYSGHLLGYSEAMRYVKDHINKDFTIIRWDSLAIPSIGVPSWKTNRALGLKDYDFKAAVTVPDGLIVANGGNLISKEQKEGKTTYIYESRIPSWRIDLAITDYKILEDSGGRFKIFTFPDDFEGAKVLLNSLVKTMDLYIAWFGPLKVFKGLTVIEVPSGYGSQADIATIIQEDSAFKDRTQHYTFYHELSHLWNVEGMDPLPPRFESEGMGMFLQHLVQEKLENKPDALENAVKISLTRMFNYFSENPDKKEIPMIAYGEEDITDLSYRMGQILYYIIYKAMGEEKMMKILGDFYQSYYETGATATEFVDYFKRQSPIDLDKLFNEWVLTAKAAEIILSEAPIAEIIKRYQ